MIELHNLYKTYRMGQVVVNALAGISFSVEKGEMVAIMGPSGSGKSTIMNIIGCLDVPSSGQYILDGRAVNGLSESDLADLRNRKIGFVFQHFNLLPRTSAIENVELPMVYGPGRVQRKRAQALLEKVGMGQRTRHLPSQLSGGEQQRVAIARALVNQPAILLADEPTGNLDSHSSSEIVDLLQQLNREDGITVVLVTHDAGIGARTRRIITLYDGQVSADNRKASGEER